METQARMYVCMYLVDVRLNLEVLQTLLQQGYQGTRLNVAALDVSLANGAFLLKSKRGVREAWREGEGERQRRRMSEGED